MAPKKKHTARRRSGRTIDDDLVEELAAKAERGYDVDEILRRRGGRPPIGSGPASVESVRLDPSSAARSPSAPNGIKSPRPQ